MAMWLGTFGSFGAMWISKLAGFQYTPPSPETSAHNMASTGLSFPRGAKEFGSLEVKGSFPRPEIFPWWKKRWKLIMYVDGLVVAGKPMPQTWSASWIWTTRRLSMDQLDEVSSRVESQNWWENFKENISFWDWNRVSDGNLPTHWNWVRPQGWM